MQWSPRLWPDQRCTWADWREFDRIYGANIAAFLKVVNAMLDQGVV